MKTHVVARGGLLTGLLLTLSCIPEFEHPLPPVAGASPDAQILGRWKGGDDGEENEVLFYPRRNGWYDILFLSNIHSLRETNGLDLSIYEGYSTTVGDDRFLCIRSRARDLAEQRNPLETNRFLLLHYQIEEGDRLSLRFFSRDAVAEMVRAGQLAGQIRTNQFTEDVMVTADGEAVAALLREKGYGAFVANESTLCFGRVK